MAGAPGDTATAVIDLLAGVAESHGLVLDGVSITPAGRRRVLRVVVDLPETQTGAVGMESVAEVSRGVSEALDASDVMGQVPYTLEVSSPGADRPLTLRRHWSRARGRMARVVLRDGADITGRVESVDDGGIGLDVDGTRTELAWERVVRGAVQLEFSHAPRDDPPDDAVEPEG